MFTAKSFKVFGVKLFIFITLKEATKLACGRAFCIFLTANVQHNSVPVIAAAVPPFLHSTAMFRMNEIVEF